MRQATLISNYRFIYRYFLFMFVSILIAGCEKTVKVWIVFDDGTRSIPAMNVHGYFNGEDGEKRDFYTDRNGSASITFNNDPGKVDYRLYPENSMFSWRVNGCDTQPVSTQGTIGPFSKEVTDVTLSMSFEGVEMWNALQLANEALDSAKTSVSKKMIPVCPGDQNKYNPKTGTITIKTSSTLPYRDETLWHEYGHAVMHWAVGGSFDTGSCATHNIRKISDPVCAWIEGWADFFSVYVKSYVYPSKEPRFLGDDIERYYSEIIDQNGYLDEGRVAAGLWDLYDSSNDCNKTFNPVYGKYTLCDLNQGNTVSLQLMLETMRTFNFQPNVRAYYTLLRPKLPNSVAQDQADEIMKYNYLSKNQ